MATYEALLSGLIVRMLSVVPEARGTAGALAEALEAAAQRVAKEAGDSRIGQALPQGLRPEVQALSWKARSARVLAGALLVFWALQQKEEELRKTMESRRN